MSNSPVKLREKVPKREQNKSDMTEHDWHLITHWWVYISVANKNIIKVQHSVERNRKILCVVLMRTNNLSNIEPREKWVEASIIQTTASLVLGMALWIHQKCLYCSCFSWNATHHKFQSLLGMLWARIGILFLIAMT